MSASLVTKCDPGHMLTLCAGDCALSITYDVIACQFSTVNMGQGQSGRNIAHNVLVTT
jgi:hypothetical protein